MTDITRSNLTTGDQKPSPAALLKEARKLIENEENWCQRAFQIGNRYCAVGALDKAMQSSVDLNTFEAAINAFGFESFSWERLSNFNDNHTHAEVLAAFDRAIELATSTEPGTPVVTTQPDAEAVVPK